MSATFRTWLTRIGSLVLGGTLLYFALRGVDFSEMGVALAEANWWWALPVVGVLLLSHWLRAWRWTLLLNEVTPAERPPLAVGPAFGSLMIGYMVNYVTPRLGEVVRSANYARRERLPLSAVVGTVVVERVLDVVMLGAGLLSVVFLLWDQLGFLQRTVYEPMAEKVANVPVGLWLTVLAVAVGVAVGLRWWRQGHRSEDASSGWRGKVQDAVSGFGTGVASLTRTRRPVTVALSTLAIWACYLFAAYLPFLMLRMAEPHALSPLDGWTIMLLGAVGQLVPSPGGVGSYHFVTIQSLTALFAVPEAPAATYAVLMHAAQLVIYSAVGFLALLAQGTSLRAVRRETSG